MKLIEKKNFIQQSIKALEEIYDSLLKLSEFKIEELNPDCTALIIVDMVNGFAREGVLKSDRVEGLIPRINEISKTCDILGIKKLAFADCHTDESPEFKSYPPHCIKSSKESEIVDEIKSLGGYTLINKNSTNGFIENEFQQWLCNNPNINTFIITGDCTDICVQQVAITLKAWFNMKNKDSKIIVPVSVVDTYDLGMHNGELMNVMALYNMQGNGIELVK